MDTPTERASGPFDTTLNFAYDHMIFASPGTGRPFGGSVNSYVRWLFWGALLREGLLIPLTVMCRTPRMRSLTEWLRQP